MRYRFLLLLCFMAMPFAADAARGGDVASGDTLTRRKGLYFNGYSGGMMIHTGYVSSNTLTLWDESGGVLMSERLQGAPFGIGGALRVNFGKYLRVGVEGYVSNLSYGRNGSYVSVGWGGALADVHWDFNRWCVFTGVTIGGGATRNLTIIGNVYSDYKMDDNISYRKYPFAALTPFVGAEYALTSKIHLVMKLDYLTNLSNWQDDFVTGPRFYVGILFCH